MTTEIEAATVPDATQSSDLFPSAYQLAASARPAKFADWGIYNFKAIMAYDGTAYK